MTSSSAGHHGRPDDAAAAVVSFQQPTPAAAASTTAASSDPSTIPDVADALAALAAPAPPNLQTDDPANGPSTTATTTATANNKLRPSTPTANNASTVNVHQNAQVLDLVQMSAATQTSATRPATTPTTNRGQEGGSRQQQQQQQYPLQTTQPAAMSSQDQYAPSTPFTPVGTTSIDHRAYMMMALASMSNAPTAMSPPPTVTPSQVTLPNPMDTASANGLIPGSTVRQPGAEKGLESFARVEFADSVFQITTYAVIIGRDQRAMEQARRDEKRADVHKRRVEENAMRGLPPPSPILHDRSKFSKSYVSEEGGMLGPESDSEESGRPAKRRKTSTAGSSQQDNEENQDNIISNRQYVSHTPGAAAVDLTSLRPSPWHVPFIGIHSPGPNIASKTKAISREHLKIAYNQQEGVFEAIPLHKNGFFCEDVHYKSEKVVLKCGDRLQIKDIDFRFIINGVERGRTGAEEYLEEKKPAKKRQTHGGKEMSFEFEQTHGNGQIQDTSDELSDVDGSLAELSDLGEGDADVDGDEEMGEDEDDDGEEGEEEALEGDGTIKTETFIRDPESGLLMPEIPKKRGPGRPPKNGIMSKREQRLLKKQQQEMAKKTLPQAPPIEPPIKRKVGRPRKHPMPENAGEQPEKRKYKPRKPREDGAEGSDAERRAREKKEKKARPKSPPLELKIEDYTEEQLQKPNKNYGVLIDETLTAAGPDGLTLKQIYKRICQRYPWFYFHTETKGWESSVRHNLIGNEAFKKDETTNLWSRVPGVELDAGKKRKASSPDRAMAAQAYGPYSYPYSGHQQPHMQAPGYGQHVPGYQVQGYGQPAQPRPMYQPQPQPHQPQALQQVQAPLAMPQQQQQQQQTQALQQSGQQPLQQPPQQPLQQPQHPPAPVAAQPTPTPIGYPPAPARPQMGAPQPGTYSSPYASRPPPAPTNTAFKPEAGPGQPIAPAQASLPKHSPGPATTPQAQPQQSVAAGKALATSPSPAATRPVIDPRLLQAVLGLTTGLVDNLKKARNPKAEAIVMSALNRCVGLKKDATENDKMEAICIKGIRQVIDGCFKNMIPTPLPPGVTSVPPGESPPIFDAKVLASLNGFKEVSIKALKARLGEAKAEAVTLSAIDRVLGFVDASIVPPGGEGEAVTNFEGVEQHLMKSIRQLLIGISQKLG